MPQYSGIPITQLQPGISIKDTDVYCAVDTTNTSQSPSGTTLKYTVGQLRTQLISSFSGSNLQSVVAVSPTNLVAVYTNGEAGVGATLTNVSTFQALTLDGVSLSVGDRVLIANQSSSLQNGIYIVTTVGDMVTPWVLTRASDFDGSILGTLYQGDFVGVVFGTIYALTFWFLTSATPIEIGIDPVVFQEQIPATGDAWVNQTATSVTMAVNTGYTASAGASLIIFTLPSVCPLGAWFEINGKDSGLFTIAQQAGQTIHSGSTSTTTGVSGSVSSTLRYTSIKLRCIIANTDFEVVSMNGSINIV